MGGYGFIFLAKKYTGSMKNQAASSDFVWSCWASSGHWICHLSGQSSLRVTEPEVSLSIIAIHPSGIGLLPYLQLLNEDIGMPVLFEKLVNVS
jgi:hypothetical protein